LHFSSEAVPFEDALFGGLRRGVVRGVRSQDADFKRGLICVEQSWDDKAGPIEPKRERGRGASQVASRFIPAGISS
jgi:integrase